VWQDWRRCPGSVAGPRPLRPRGAPAGRDYQRARFYRWEQEHVLRHHATPLSLAACRALVETAYRWLEPEAARLPGWRPPLVGDGRGRRHACGSREVIKLPRWARTAPIVLHECAHGVTPDKHGPRFVRVYVDLLVQFLGLAPVPLLASLGEAGIDVAVPLRCGISGNGAGGNGRGRGRKAAS